MQDKPEAVDLLEAIQEFIKKDILPAVKEDSALSFKSLVSWNMLGVLAREMREGPALMQADMQALQELLQDSPAPDQAGERSQSAANDLQRWQSLQKQVAAKIRSADLHEVDSESWNTVRESLQRKLQIANPRFSTK